MTLTASRFYTAQVDEVIEFTANGTPPGGDYSWSLSGGHSASDPASNSQTVNFDNPGSYHVLRWNVAPASFQQPASRPGGVFSVALSVARALRPTPLGVTQRPGLSRSGLSSPRRTSTPPGQRWSPRTRRG